MVSYGLLLSGMLGLNCLEQICSDKIEFVMTDKHSIPIIDYCKCRKIPFYVGNPNKGRALASLKISEVDVILSINYIFIIDNSIIAMAKKYAVNFHGSLLPKFRGRTPHIWAIINNETETGITAHLITEKCDEGDIIYQEKILIDGDMTGAEILEIFKIRYSSILLHVMDLLESGNVNPVKQDSNLATYFGKRTPDDGEINWNWQKERIKNWVRALARPYPGAFTFYEGQKVKIHKIEFCEWTYNCGDENGKILANSGDIIVKTPNGAIKLINIETEIPIKFKNEIVLHGQHTDRDSNRRREL